MFFSLVIWASLNSYSGCFFWTKIGIDNRRKIRIFYDDRCNLCDKTVRFIGIVDLFGRVIFAPLSSKKSAEINGKRRECECCSGDLHGSFDDENNMLATFFI